MQKGIPGSVVSHLKIQGKQKPKNGHQDISQNRRTGKLCDRRSGLLGGKGRPWTACRGYPVFEGSPFSECQFPTWHHHCPILETDRMGRSNAGRSNAVHTTLSHRCQPPRFLAALTLYPASCLDRRTRLPRPATVHLDSTATPSLLPAVTAAEHCFNKQRQSTGKLCFVPQCPAC